MTKTSHGEDLKKAEQVKKKKEIREPIVFKSVDDGLDTALTHLKNIQGRKWLGLDTGYPSLNYRLNGLRGLTIIGSQPNSGKTAFILNIMLNMLKQGVQVILINKDMGEMDIYMRVFQILLKLEYNNFKDCKGNDGTDYTYESMVADIQEHQGLFKNFYISNEWDDMSLFRTVRALRDNDKPIIVFIDYLQCISIDSTSYMSENQEDKKRIIAIKKIQKELAIPFVCVTEARKPSNNKDKNKNLNWTHGMGDIMGTAMITYVADAVLLMRQRVVSDDDDSEIPLQERARLKDNSISFIDLNIAKVRDGGLKGEILYEYYWRKNIFVERSEYDAPNQDTKKDIKKKKDVETVQMDGVDSEIVKSIF